MEHNLPALILGDAPPPNTVASWCSSPSGRCRTEQGAARVQFPAAMPDSPRVPVGGPRPLGKRRVSAYNLFQQTVTADAHEKFGGADAFNSAVRLRFGSRPTTVSSKPVMFSRNAHVWWPWSERRENAHRKRESHQNRQHSLRIQSISRKLICGGCIYLCAQVSPGIPSPSFALRDPPQKNRAGNHNHAEPARLIFVLQWSAACAESEFGDVEVPT